MPNKPLKGQCKQGEIYIYNITREMTREKSTNVVIGVIDRAGKQREEEY
jgi:hypothetical protein